jgi:hypothetical protein
MRRWNPIQPASGPKSTPSAAFRRAAPRAVLVALSDRLKIPLLPNRKIVLYPTILPYNLYKLGRLRLN